MEYILLFIVCMVGDDKIVNLLLEKKVNINLIDKKGFSLFYVVC